MLARSTALAFGGCTALALLLSGMAVAADTAPASGQNLEVDYLRLSGGLSVPLFVQAQSVGGVSFWADEPIAHLGLRDPAEGYTNVVGNTSSNVKTQRGLISRDVAEFWAASEYREAMPLATELWVELAQEGWAGHRLVASADGSAQDLYCALSLTVPWMLQPDPGQENYIPEYPVGEVYPTRVPDFVYTEIDPEAECLEVVAEKVGFLFVIVTNTGSDHIRAVKASSLRFEAGSLDPAIWRTVESSKFEYLSEAQSGLTDAQFAQLSAGKPHTHELQELAPGESFMWLLSTYRVDDDQFEGRYLRPAEVPTRLDFERAGVEQTFNMPLPTREDTQSVSMPFGWYRS